MTLEQIKYFMAAAEYQHVGKAAHSVHISPSAVSAAIGALEDELKIKLFDRRSKRIYLTPKGFQFKQWGEKIFKEVASVKFQLRELPRELGGRFRLGASHFLATEILAPAWFELQNEHPLLIGDIRSLDTGILISEILNGRLDLGIAFSPNHHPDIEQTKIYVGDLVIVANKKHPLLKKRRAIESLSDYPCVTHKAVQGVEICEEHPIFSKLGIIPSTSVYFDNDEVALTKIRHSQAWGLLPDLVVKKWARELEVIYRDKSGKTSYSVCVVRHRGKGEDLPIAKFVEKIKARLAVNNVEKNRRPR